MDNSSSTPLPTRTSHADLDAVFAALSDPTRRAVIRRLGTGPATVGDLARGFDMALPSFLKHVRALEACGLIRTRKTGRVRSCALSTARLGIVEHWLADQRRVWEGRGDRLAALVEAEAETDAAAESVHAAPAPRTAVPARERSEPS